LAQPKTVASAPPPAELTQSPTDAAHSEVLAEATRANMPPGPAEAAPQPTADVPMTVSAPPQQAAVPDSSPAPAEVAPTQRKYWVLKFDPPPKFRQ
jgi:hypothetical protein